MQEHRRVSCRVSVNQIAGIDRLGVVFAKCMASRVELSLQLLLFAVGVVGDFLVVSDWFV